MTQVKPLCPEGYIFHKINCSCIKNKNKENDETEIIKRILLKKFLKTTTKKKPTVTKKKQTVTKKKQIATKKKQTTAKKIKLDRCPNGSNRNRKTRECVHHYNRKTIKRNIRNENYKKNMKALKNPTPTTQKLKAPKKTASVARKTKKVQFKKTQIVIKDETSSDLKEISRAIQRIAQITPEILTKKAELTKNIKKTMVSNNSYSPSINEELVTLQRAENKNVFGCGIDKKIDFNKSEYKIILPKVKIGKDENGNPICGTRKDPKVVERMLHNLSIKKVDASKFIAPLQKHSNCWFNAMFVCFFLSDKGRKFFRFFRQLMITGKYVDGKAIKSDRIAEALFLLNLCVEASFNREEVSDNSNMALTMDTNFIISTIYKHLPLAMRNENEMPDVGNEFNPLEYYIGIMNYLNNRSINLQEIAVDTLKRIRNRSVSKVPHIYVASVQFSESTQKNDIPKTFIVKHDGKKYKYKLDSAVVMDTMRNHFCALLTCNGVQKGFDGASFKRINDFKWLPLLNMDKNWTFEGSSNTWNFKDSYQLLFYYRTNIN